MVDTIQSISIVVLAIGVIYLYLTRATKEEANRYVSPPRY